MVRAFLRLVVLLIVLVAAAAFLLGWWGSGRTRTAEPTSGAVGTGGVNSERARQIGAEVGERTAAVASETKRALTDGQITAKIKAKLALDDTVKALSVDVDTNGPIVTVSGSVDTAAQRDRVIQLARETEGVKQVVDHMRVR
jgi:hyperosmotically inducible periplasmic protein